MIQGVNIIQIRVGGNCFGSFKSRLKIGEKWERCRIDWENTNLTQSGWTKDSQRQKKKVYQLLDVYCKLKVNLTAIEQWTDNTGWQREHHLAAESDQKLRKTWGKFRQSGHNPAIETGGHRQTRQTQRKNRRWRFCQEQEAETEQHFLLRYSQRHNKKVLFSKYKNLTHPQAKQNVIFTWGEKCHWNSRMNTSQKVLRKTEHI